MRCRQRWLGWHGHRRPELVRRWARHAAARTLPAARSGMGASCCDLQSGPGRTSVPATQFHAQAVGGDTAAPAAAGPAGHHEAGAGARPAAGRGLHLLRRSSSRMSCSGRASSTSRTGCTGRYGRRCSSATRSTPVSWCSTAPAADRAGRPAGPGGRLGGPASGWAERPCERSDRPGGTGDRLQ